ncbi:MAG: elongation factor P [Patescibacteria group bacterium]|nr:elongation factor P [Patescibacteria group bacterium]
MASTSEIKKGAVLKFKDDLWLVTEFQHINPGKGSAFVRTRLKNIKTGKSLENTFKVSESVDIEELTRKNMNYLYADAGQYNFMDPVSYEQISLGADVLGDTARFLKENLEVMILYHNDAPVTVEIPKKITYKIVEAMPAVKGDTASGNVTKEVVLENGLNVQAPLFINQGESIVINTDTGEYVERAKS